jgi:hypothetical protein
MIIQKILKKKVILKVWITDSRNLFLTGTISLFNSRFLMKNRLYHNSLSLENPLIQEIGGITYDDEDLSAMNLNFQLSCLTTL